MSGRRPEYNKSFQFLFIILKISKKFFRKKMSRFIDDSAALSGKLLFSHLYHN
jgi:hypothetical protein